MGERIADMLTEAEFIAVYGVPRSWSIVGCTWVSSAITKDGRYVRYDHGQGRYLVSAA